VTKRRLVIASTLALSAMVLVGSNNAQAQLLVLSSNWEKLPANTELGEADHLNIPEGITVRVLLPSGSTTVITGPADKLVKDLIKGQPLHEALWNRIKNYLAGRDHNKSAGSRSPLSERGPEARKALLSFSIVPIPAFVSDGAICVLNETPLSFSRLGVVPLPNVPERTPIMRFSAGKTTLDEKHAVIRWEGESDTAPWPGSVSVVNGGWYFAAPNFGLQSRFEIRTVARASIDGDDVLKVLEENRCYEQMKALVWRLSGRG
jgi:hypothetical protein